MKKILTTCAAVTAACSIVQAGESLDYGDQTTCQQFVSVGGGFMFELEEPYFLAKWGVEVGQSGNLGLQFLYMDYDFEGTYQGLGYTSDFSTLALGIAYTHYFPTSDNGAFYVSGSFGAAYHDYDFDFDGSVSTETDTRFYLDGAVGYEHFISNYWIANIGARVIHFDQVSGTEAEFDDAYFGVEAGLTFVF